ncbi:hypothetical protein HYPSUDRAFT_590837 [Hypholoma sublateritium FD-334 SS-4]|uniref:Uncharacterized protein n=1 Tax=Hypholoma sublateritium (strain FD-334 SS-4) TaxID=945553 RepID=A0A0D2NWT3_HYPSF|nr:hypothetical protein HYPSUDRAFT_590837 [Hypholoma sublateritium FD-334 SS-4]
MLSSITIFELHAYPPMFGPHRRRCVRVLRHSEYDTQSLRFRILREAQISQSSARRNADSVIFADLSLIKLLFDDIAQCILWISVSSIQSDCANESRPRPLVSIGKPVAYWGLDNMSGVGGLVNRRAHQHLDQRTMYIAFQNLGLPLEIRSGTLAVRRPQASLDPKFRLYHPSTSNASISDYESMPELCMDVFWNLAYGETARCV